MEHIIQIGVSIDDDRIEKAVIESAQMELKKELRNAMFDERGWNTELTRPVQEIVKSSLAEWKEEIINLAAAQVVETIKHSKAYREKVKEITNDV